KRMEDWADFFPKYTVLPWLKGAEHERVQVMRDYIRVAFRRINIGTLPKRAIARKIYELIAAPARWRLDHDFYFLPVEIWLKRWADKMPSLAAPATSTAQPSEAVTC